MRPRTGKTARTGGRQASLAKKAIKRAESTAERNAMRGDAPKK